MRKQDFYRLPRSLQDRFIESSQGVSVPKPLLVVVERDWSAARWGGAALVIGLLWVWYISLGYGDLGSSFALGGVVQLIGHVLLAGAVAFCGLRAVVVSWEATRRPFGTGSFLFPSGVLRVRGAELIQYDASEVGAATARAASVEVEVGRERFVFPAASAETAELALASFQEGKKLWASLPSDNLLERARLSPLLESGVPNPLAPTDPHPRPRLLPSPAFFAVVLLLSGCVGFAVHTFRTNLSEKALYRAAVEENTVHSLQAYLARGGQRPEVGELLLPRAELALAREQGSVAAILAYRKDHPDSQIQAEIQEALRLALLAELDKAKAKGTLTAIDELSKRHADHQLIAGEIAHARRGIIEKALQQMLSASNPETEDLAGFIRSLLAYAETHGPKVLLRIRQEFSQDPKDLDGLVMKSKKYYLGQKQLPTQYFLGDQTRAREKKLLETIRDRLQSVVQKDVLEFEIAPLPSQENTTFTDPVVPTLSIEHKERLSGGFVGGKPRGMYMGAAVYFTSSFQIPEGPSLEHKLTQWRPPRFTIPGTETELTIPGVYEDMIGGAFDKYAERYLGFWFKEPS